LISFALTTQLSLNNGRGRTTDGRMPAQKKRQLRGFVYSLLRSLSLTSHCTAQQTNEGQFYGFIVLQTAEHTWNEERMMTDGN